MDSERPIADKFDGIAHPADVHALQGHGEIAGQLCANAARGNLHHALLLSGPQGIGKASFALRFAAALLRSNHAVDPQSVFAGLQPVEDETQAKITAGAHPNLLHLTRPWDEKAKRFKTRLTVDEVRQIKDFFGTSRGEEGWRVAIIDSVDDMNENAANALLKALEEPPEKTVFFCIAHSLARVMPTIRSRCRHVPMQALSDDALLAALSALEIDDEVQESDRDLLVTLSSGSVRKAITLIREGGLELHRDFERLVLNLANPSWRDIHALADKICGRGGEDRYFLFLDFANQFMEAQATGKTGASNPISTLARWAEVWEKAQHSVRTAESYNLDRKQVILNLFDEMGQAARA